MHAMMSLSVQFLATTSCRRRRIFSVFGLVRAVYGSPSGLTALYRLVTPLNSVVVDSRMAL